jgi:sec-independent protein translocase protein TatC
MAVFATAGQPHDDSSAPGSTPLLDLLEDIRRRIFRACLAVAAGMVVAFIFINPIVTFVLAPTRRALPPGTHLIYTNPAEAFSLDIDIALIAGLVFASPFIVFQIWRLIAPALYAREKKLAVPFVLLATGGAIGGAAFAHFIVFPYMITFFGTFATAKLAFMPRVEDVFNLYAKMVVAMMGVFQIPTIVTFLARMGILRARTLWRYTKYAILAMFIIGAIITPPDATSQVMVALPMVGLYLFSVLLAWIVQPKSK